MYKVEDGGDKAKHRLSSTSTQDSGHKSDSIDRSTTNSSRSDSSHRSDEAVTSQSGLTHSSCVLSHSTSGLTHNTYALSHSMSGLTHSTSMFSIDDDFVFINSKQRNIDYNRNFVKPVVISEVPSGRKCRIDPIYEMIPEQSESDEMYCLPLDNVRQQSPAPAKTCSKPVSSPVVVEGSAAKPVSPAHKPGKTRSKSSDKIRDLIRPRSGNFLDPF